MKMWEKLFKLPTRRPISPLQSPSAPPLETAPATPERKPREESSKEGREGVADWRDGILHLLDDDDGLELFKEYLEQQRRGHCLTFYHACRGWKLGPPEEKRKVAKMIYKTYIMPTSANALECLDEDVRRAIVAKKSKEPIDVDIFDAAQQQVLDFMGRTSYVKFFESDIYLDYVQSAQITDSCTASKSPSSSTFSEEGCSATGGKLGGKNQTKQTAASTVDSSASQGKEKEEEEVARQRQIEANPKDGAVFPRRGGNPYSSLATREPAKFFTEINKELTALLDKEVSTTSTTNPMRTEGLVSRPTATSKQPEIVHKQHRRSINYDQESTDQSILDEHCSRVFDNSPSPPRQWKKPQAKVPEGLAWGAAWGVNHRQSQPGCGMPSWKGELHMNVYLGSFYS